MMLVYYPGLQIEHELVEKEIQRKKNLEIWKYELRDLDAMEYPDLEVEHELVETQKLLSFLQSSERELIFHLIDVTSQRDEAVAKADVAIEMAAPGF